MIKGGMGMFCNMCGRQNPDDSKFCSECGAPMNNVQSDMPRPVWNTLQSPVENPVMATNQPPVSGKAIPQKKKKVHKKNKTTNVIIACLVALIVLLSGILIILIRTGGDFSSLTGKDKGVASNDANGDGDEFTEVVDNVEFSGTYLARPTLTETSVLLNENSDVVASVPVYQVASDFSNVYDVDRFDYCVTNSAYSSKLLSNGFVVTGGWDCEFFDSYESNRYNQKASFVTVDSLMHSYHLYFSALLKKVERDNLKPELTVLSEAMFNTSVEQYNTLKGTEWESAARRNVGFFAVGAKLLNCNISVPDYVASDVNTEITRINDAAGIDTSVLFDEVYEDYTQYKPRGYYEGDSNLESYFRAMMWYGRMPYEQKNEDMDRSAVLMTLGMQGAAYDSWEKIYAVTSFFAGASDDMGYCEYLPIIQSVYGENITVDKLVGDNAKWSSFHALTGKLTPPAINSIPIEDGESNEIVSFRFMGQRFSIDAQIMQNLVYQNVGANSSGDMRMLPSTLDVMSALGSDKAYEVLQANGDTAYAGYTENMDKLRTGYSNASSEVWSASLYSGWINTIRPLLTEKGEGYPMFMQNDAWTLKQMETFAGSYAELKHDTILYSKQVMAEMGGGDDETVYDDRGYVEPEPNVYARFANLATKTMDGLKSYGYLSDNDAENLGKMATLATNLMTISEKELQNQSLTDSEYDLIRNYGGTIEHFWLDATKELTGDESPNSTVYRCPIIADVATDPNGSVLEIGTGGAADIIVIVPVDGQLKFATGSVYSYYEFAWPMSDRLTDSKWKQMLGMEMLDDGSYNYEHIGMPSQPSWTSSYRVTY